MPVKLSHHPAWKANHCVSSNGIRESSYDDLGTSSARCLQRFVGICHQIACSLRTEWRWNRGREPKEGDGTDRSLEKFGCRLTGRRSHRDKDLPCTSTVT